MAKRETLFYSTKDLAEILGVHTSTVREHAAAGLLPAIRIGRLWRFPKKQIDAWLEQELPSALGSTARPVSMSGSDLADVRAGDAEEGLQHEMDAETREWMEADLVEPLPPYDWGNVDPLTLGKPVRYVAGMGLVIETSASSVEPTSASSVEPMSASSVEPEKG